MSVTESVSGMPDVFPPCMNTAKNAVMITHPCPVSFNIFSTNSMNVNAPPFTGLKVFPILPTAHTKPVITGQDILNVAPNVFMRDVRKTPTVPTGQNTVMQMNTLYYPSSEKHSRPVNFRRVPEWNCAAFCVPMSTLHTFRRLSQMRTDI